LLERGGHGLGIKDYLAFSAELPTEALDAVAAAWSEANAPTSPLWGGRGPELVEGGAGGDKNLFPHTPPRRYAPTLPTRGRVKARAPTAPRRAFRARSTSPPRPRSRTAR
jgi:hypothetical protein